MPPAAPAPRPTAAPAPAPRHEATPAPAHHKPPRSWMLAATAIVLAEAALLALLAWRAGAVVEARMEYDELQQAQLNADRIRAAWDDLAQKGSLLKARLASANATMADLQKRLRDAGRAQGLAVELDKPRKLPSHRGVTAEELTVRTSGAESRLFAFLLAIDRLPAVMELQSIQLAGTEQGHATLKLTLQHVTISKSVARRLGDFVDKLPRLAAPRAAGAPYERPADRPLFLPATPTDEEALRGWPKILLKGFTQDRAFMDVGGESKILKQGDTVTADITYVEKVSVNVALLKRGADGTEVLLTVGSPTYALKPSEVRGMSEFVVTLQRQDETRLLKDAVLP